MGERRPCVGKRTHRTACISSEVTASDYFPDDEYFLDDMSSSTDATAKSSSSAASYMFLSLRLIMFGLLVPAIDLQVLIWSYLPDCMSNLISTLVGPIVMFYMSYFWGKAYGKLLIYPTCLSTNKYKINQYKTLPGHGSMTTWIFLHFLWYAYKVHLLT